mgnify:CR=1 FL=1
MRYTETIRIGIQYSKIISLDKNNIKEEIDFGGYPYCMIKIAENFNDFELKSDKNDKLALKKEMSKIKRKMKDKIWNFGTQPLCIYKFVGFSKLDYYPIFNMCVIGDGNTSGTSGMSGSCGTRGVLK